MDPRHFDALSRVLATVDSRRSLVAFLATLPVLGGLLGILSPEETEAAGRRKRRKKAHKHGKGRRRKHKRKNPQCTPTTCAEQGKTCGRLSDGCGTTLDCGPCTCATGCPDCQTCNPATGLCDPVTNGTVCDDGDACTRTDTCQDGDCVGMNPVVCTPLDACHIAGVCNPDTGICSNPDKCPAPQDCVGDICCTTAGNTAAGEVPCCTGLTQCTDGVCRADCCAGVTCDECQICQGGACVADAAQSGKCCTGTDGVCAGGVCTPCDAFPNSFCDAAMGTCACTPDSTCPGGQTCGTASDGCGGLVSCGSCGSGTTPACNAGTCATCAATCRAACYYCLNLVDGSTRCTGGYGTSCSSCSTNAECTGGDLCVSTSIERISGRTTSLPADCSQTAPGVCANVGPCFG